MAKKNYTIIATGEKPDETGILFIDADSMEDALNNFLYVHNDFEEDEIIPINALLEEYPVGICETGGSNPYIEWYTQSKNN